MVVKLNGTADNPLGYVISKTENSFLVSISLLGAIIGASLFGLLGTKFGRKPLLTFLGLPFILCYLIMAWSKVIWIFFVARFITGISLGGVYTILPMYCGEISDASNRGILGASIAVFVNIGMLIPYSLGPYMTFFSFHVVLAILPVVFMVPFYFLAPESPYYLIKTDEQAAKAVLLKIRQREVIPDLMKEMKDSLEQNNNASIIEILRSKAMRKSLVIGLGAFTFMQLTGMGVVATYNQTIFKEAGGDIAPELGPVIIGVTQLIMSVSVSSITDKYPRKFLLTLSHLLVGLVQIPFGTYFFLQRQNYDVSNISWMPLVCLICMRIQYRGWTYTYDLPRGTLSSKIKRCSSLLDDKLYNWIGAFLMSTFFNTLNDIIGIGILFWVYSVCSFVAIIFIKFFMIETKGKTLEQIQRELE